MASPHPIEAVTALDALVDIARDRLVALSDGAATIAETRAALNAAVAGLTDDQLRPMLGAAAVETAAARLVLDALIETSPRASAVADTLTRAVLAVQQA